ncbi:hypothetical protein M9H77_34262 [Catharanthus roseus]|uniref:Uncharacterized protein n=1 Tax=Catharanthus roseus TaxID=4058 RepID=A0ACB9ZPX7_CATRO|nr:hypothetical protein M9H77_34262 [Catharanthus roseus]
MANFRAYHARLQVSMFVLFYLYKACVFFNESGYFPPIVRGFLFYTDVPCTVIIVTMMVTSCGPCINLTFQNPVLIACTLSTNLMPNYMSVIESFQSSNRTVPDSIMSSTGEPEPISRNAPDCV